MDFRSVSDWEMVPLFTAGGREGTRTGGRFWRISQGGHRKNSSSSFCGVVLFPSPEKERPGGKKYPLVFSVRNQSARHSLTQSVSQSIFRFFFLSGDSCCCCLATRRPPRRRRSGGGGGGVVRSVGGTRVSIFFLFFFWGGGERSSSAGGQLQ